MALFSGSQFKLKLFLWLYLLFLTACANQVAPTGGPKDETPPKVTKTSPPDLSTRFTGKEIVLSFDEFIKLKDINNQLIISPPLKETPNFKTRGKSLVVEFKEPFRQETTYNVFFGDAIVDITEENPIPGYKFTFSTGDILDSMNVKGKLINAFNLTPVKGAYVMLYDSIYDSVPYKQIPYYVSRTNDKGEFELTNLRNIPYKIFALTDANANYRYDMPSEEIAFIDSIIHPWELPKKTLKIKGDSTASKTSASEVQDSVVVKIGKNDSLIIADTLKTPLKPDTLASHNDSLVIEGPEGKYLQLFHFKEVDSVQSLLKTQLVKENVLSFIFKYPVIDPSFNILTPGYDKKPIVYANRTSDTLTMWLPAYLADSIKLEVFHNHSVIDTVQMLVKPREKPGKKNEAKKPAFVNITSNIQAGKIKPQTPLWLTFADPIVSFDFKKIKILEDSLEIKNVVPEWTDSIRKKLKIDVPWKEGGSYTVIIDDSTFISVFDLKNDSTALKFTGTTAEESAEINLKVKLPESTPYIIQLMDEKEKLISQYFISESTTINFKYLAPAKYKIKAIDDRNGNGYWDTGKYLAKRYPERVLYYSTVLELRANWIVEQEWVIPEPGK